MTTRKPLILNVAQLRQLDTADALDAGAGIVVSGVTVIDASGNVDASRIATGIIPVARGGTGVGALPAFTVVKDDGSAQSLTASDFTRITWPTEQFDATNAFASSTFTPLTAGKYLMTCTLMVNTTNVQAGKIAILSLYKNGDRHKENRIVFSANATNHQFNLSAVVAANGTTDYFEIYVFHTCTSNLTMYANTGTDGGQASVHWSGAWVAP